MGFDSYELAWTLVSRNLRLVAIATTVAKQRQENFGIFVFEVEFLNFLVMDFN